MASRDYTFVNGTWFFDDNGTVSEVKDKIVLNVLQNYDGVTGSYPNQQFSQVGIDALVPYSTVNARISADYDALEGGGTTVKAGAIDFPKEWEALGFGDASTFPPKDFLGAINGPALQAFFKAVSLNRPASEALTFDLREWGGDFMVMLPGTSTAIALPGFAGEEGGEFKDDFSAIAIPGTDSVIVTQDGTWKIIKASVAEIMGETFQLGDPVESGGFNFVETSPGRWERLPGTAESGGQASTETIDGRDYVRNADGSLTALPRQAPLTVEQMIAQAIADGDWEKAIALDDFKDRPTATDRLSFALQYARSPAEASLLSSLARGEGGLVDHAFSEGRKAQAEGTVRRVGPPPDFLQQAYNDMFGQSGITPTNQDYISALQSSEDTELDAANKQNEELERLLRESGEKAEADRLELIALHEQELKDAEAEFDKQRQEEDDQRILDAQAAKLIELEKQVALDVEENRKKAEAESAVIDTFDEGGGDGFDLGDFNPTPILDTPDTFDEGGDFGPLQVTEPAPNLLDEGGDFQGTTALVEPEPEPAPTNAQLSETFNSTLTQAELDDEGDFFAEGGIIDDGTAIVGENGPELLRAPKGAQVIPLSKLELKRLRERGVKGLALGGNVASFPLGVQQVIAGGIVNPTRSILPAAGLALPSAQAQQNLLPFESEFLRNTALEAGIDEQTFDAELAAVGPGRGRGRATFTPRVSR